MTGRLLDWIRARTTPENFRYAAGKAAGTIGIAVNLALFASKLTVGILSGSIAVTADALNNLSDSAGAIVTAVSFKLSGAPPDKEHPFGHGRMEYIAPLAVAMLILLAGFELGKTAVGRILEPQPISVSWVMGAALALSLAAKGWMTRFYRNMDAAVDSVSLRAAAADSRNDIVCTGAVLASVTTQEMTGLACDGYIGLGAAAFVVWAGVIMARDTVSLLLGQAPDRELLAQVRESVLAHDGILGVHDVVIHNYGPDRMMISLHAEVSASADMLKSHEMIDVAERALSARYNAQVCIHMDPVDTADERVGQLRTLATAMLSDVDPALTLHDFRVVFGEAQINLIFDLAVPYGYKDAAIQEQVRELERRMQSADCRLRLVVTTEYGTG